MRLLSRMSGGEAVKRPRMHHARYRKPLCGQLETTDPSVTVSLTTALQRLPPVAEHAFPEQPEAIEISRHSVVVEVPCTTDLSHAPV
jgi:hypothetical protein